VALPTLRPLPKIIATLAMAAAGAGGAAALNLPAAYLTGGMIAVTAASLAGFDTRLPRRLLEATLVLIGLILGAGVTPELIGRAGSWPLSLAILAASVAVVQAAAQVFYVRVGGWDRDTAFFASLPGALSYVLAIAAETKADMAKVVIGQSIRLFLLVATLPAIIETIDKETAAPVAPPMAAPADLILLVAASAAAALLFQRLRFPGALLAGSLAASAALHGSGAVTGSLPYPVMIACFVVLGAFVGSRFAGTDIWLLRRTALVSLGAFIVATAIAGLFALAVAALTGTDLPQVFLAYAPGGLDTMTTLAIALHMDSAFVAAHQLARFILIAVTAPVVARWMLRRGR
jgi:membrane AbrB-like protein